MNTKSSDDLSKQIEAIEKKILSLLNRYSSLSIVDLAKIDAELNVYQDLIDYGYEDRVNAFLDKYQDAINEVLDRADKAGVRGLARISFDDLQYIKDTHYDILLGKAKIYADQVKSALMTGYIIGEKPEELKARIGLINLTDSQTNAMLNTFRADISRAASAKVYENAPEIKFKYLGPIVEHSSEECKWLILNQRKEGYTKAEIDKGIETPFIYKSGELQGQKKKIYWSGRKPNFNCLHEWVQI